MERSDRSLCWWNSVRVSYVNMGSKRRAFSGPPDRPIMFESCRMPSTVARSQCLTGDAVGEGILYTAACQFIIHAGYNSLIYVPSLCVLQYHRCPHSGITAKTVHTGASGAYNPIPEIHTVSILCSDSCQGQSNGSYMST